MQLFFGVLAFVLLLVLVAKQDHSGVQAFSSSSVVTVARTTGTTTTGRRNQNWAFVPFRHPGSTRPRRSLLPFTSYARRRDDDDDDDEKATSRSKKTTAMNTAVNVLRQ